LPGIKGSLGDSCKNCFPKPGKKGEIGNIGKPGNYGSRGLQGECGPVGSKGLPGNTGLVGNKGLYVKLIYFIFHKVHAIYLFLLIGKRWI
jgi:hypothetical protein